MSAGVIDIGAAEPSSRGSSRIGWALTGLVGLFLLMDTGMKLAGMPVVSETSQELGWTGDIGYWRGMGALLLGIAALYLWPRTAVFGAILLTGYLGGAIATHARIGSPLLSHTLFGVYIGVLAWLGLWLRMPTLRRLVPLATRRKLQCR